MGKSVTVDSDDLQALLFTTGAIKQVESAMAMRTRDPLVKVAQPVLSQAHDRLARQWRAALREDTHPLWGQPLDDDEAAILTDLATDCYETRTPKEFSKLNAKGYLEMGAVYDAVCWPGSDSPHLTDCARFRLRVTTRGIDALAAWAEAAGKPLMQPSQMDEVLRHGPRPSAATLAGAFPMERGQGQPIVVPPLSPSTVSKPDAA